nr:hypothetical protein CFP56_21307 [Quercus suber]
MQVQQICRESLSVHIDSSHPTRPAPCNTQFTAKFAVARDLYRLTTLKFIVPNEDTKNTSLLQQEDCRGSNLRRPSCAYVDAQCSSPNSAVCAWLRSSPRVG